MQLKELDSLDSKKYQDNLVKLEHFSLNTVWKLRVQSKIPSHTQIEETVKVGL